jgi:hypothetical protein
MMRVILDLFQPSLHWVALARVIENNPDLPAEFDLVVRKDRISIQDGTGSEVPVPCQPFSHSEGLVHNIDGKLSVLAWIHECFPALPNTPA